MPTPEQGCNMVHVHVASPPWLAREMEGKMANAPHLPDEVSPATAGDVSLTSCRPGSDGSHAGGERPGISTGAADVIKGGPDAATTRSSKQKSESQGVESSPQASAMSCRASLSVDLSCLNSQGLFQAIPFAESRDLLLQRSAVSAEHSGASHSLRTNQSPLSRKPEGLLTRARLGTGNRTPEDPLSRTPKGALTPPDSQTTAHPFSSLELPPSVPSWSSALTSPRSAHWARRANRAQRGHLPGVPVPGAPPSQGRKAPHSASAIPLPSAFPRSGSEPATPGPGAPLGHSWQEGMWPRIGPARGLSALSMGSTASYAQAPGEGVGAAMRSPEHGGAVLRSDSIPVMRLSPLSASALPCPARRGRRHALVSSMDGGLDRSHSCGRRTEPRQDALVPSTRESVDPTSEVIAGGSLKGGRHFASLAANRRGSTTPDQCEQLTRMRPASPPALPQGQILQRVLLKWKDPSSPASENAVGGDKEVSGLMLGGAVADESADRTGAKARPSVTSEPLQGVPASPWAVKSYLGGQETRTRLAEDWVQNPEKQSLKESVVEDVLERLDHSFRSQFEGLNATSGVAASQRAAATTSPWREGGRGDKSVHLITGGRPKGSVTPHGFITPLGVSQVRLERARLEREAEGPSLEKARAAAEDTNFVRRLQKERDQAELSQRIVEARSKGWSRGLEDTATLPSGSMAATSAMNGVPGRALSALQGEKGSSEPAERRRPKQGDMLRRYILSRQEGQRRILELQSITPDLQGESGDGGGSNNGRAEFAPRQQKARKDPQQDGSSFAESRLGGRSASRRSGTGGVPKADVNRSAMSVLAPSRSERSRSVEKASSELVLEAARDQKQRVALKALKPHQLCILNRPYKDVREYYALHNQKFASGRFGVIRRCKDPKTGKIYACKTIPKKKVLGAEEADGIRAEVAALTMLRGHPSVVKIMGAFEDHQAVHLVMEYCAGGDLFDRVRLKGSLAEEDAARLMAALVSALNECHCRGIIHRDIKPENVLLTSTEADYDIKLVDFGVAAIFQPGKLLHGIAGTPEYMAPEVLKRRYGPQVDIWSAGILLYVALSGLQPFWAASKHGLMTSVLQNEPSFKSPRWASVSEEAVDLVKRMLDKDPGTRITGEEVLLHPWLQKHAKERSLSGEL